MTKLIEFVITRFVFSSSTCTRIRFRPGLRGSAPDPAGELAMIPQTPSRVGGVGEGDSRPIPLPWTLSTPFELAPTAPRFAGPPHHKILATPVTDK